MHGHGCVTINIVKLTIFIHLLASTCFRGWYDKSPRNTCEMVMDTICYMMLDRKRNRVRKIWTIITLLFDGLETSVLHNMICLLNSLIYVNYF
ncbi:hypothetical protein L1887_08486 [Cichorium endivia]|nr:hypothetical protein L1887_08486 [Cichorium endivia]